MPLPLSQLNHISRVTSDVNAAAEFYISLLGFKPISRPQAFDFGGAWLYGHGIALHLIEGNPVPRPAELNSRADHISFVGDIPSIEQTLQSLGISYIKELVVEMGIQVEQLFFHDPDNNVIEICNCDLLPVRLLDTGEVVVACAMGNSGKQQQQNEKNSGPGSNYSSDTEARVSVDLSPRHFGNGVA